MTAHAGLVPNANLNTSVLPAEVITGCRSASREEDRRDLRVLKKGVTPVRLEEMEHFLNKYPDKEAAKLLRDGFREGFKIPFVEMEVRLSTKNLKSAREFPEVVTEKLHKEVALGRMAGPFDTAPIDNLRVSPLGVVPKKEPNKFRLIHHLSFPKGSSVNDGIDPQLCSVLYTSFDSAMSWVRKSGQGAMLAKTDIEAAFRLLPVHPDSMHLLGCFWDGGFFVDRCLPMGCSLSCAYFEAFSTFLEWVVKDVTGLGSCVHYLDDFLFVGSAFSSDCSVLLHSMEGVAKRFGVPLAAEKTVGPVTSLSFLGIEIDTVAMECRLPEDKLVNMRLEVKRVGSLKKVTLREVQSLLGKLNFACRIMPMGRVFCRRLSLATIGIRAPNHFIRLRRDLKDDLKVWEFFLESYNGKSLWIAPVVSAEFLGILIGSADESGFSLFFRNEWLVAEWPKMWKDNGLVADLTLCEVFPIVVALTLWGGNVRDKKICFRCGSIGAMEAINSLSSSKHSILRVLQHLVWVGLNFNLWVTAEFGVLKYNNILEALSSSQWDRVRELAPQVEPTGKSRGNYLFGSWVIHLSSGRQ
ncbi:uncharacterized protein [Ranitomeya imitator]|uniref:uncharacterized protein n=1 Tax=Ranitomeya imitator TaxID=111125 RepID=UPI0037E7B045